MSPRATIPLNSDISAALAMFFHGGAGPSHTTITTVLTGSGYGDDYVYTPSIQGKNKEQRVLQALRIAQREPARARHLVDELLSALRVAGLIGSDAAGEDVESLGLASGEDWAADPFVGEPGELGSPTAPQRFEDFTGPNS